MPTQFVPLEFGTLDNSVGQARTRPDHAWAMQNATTGRGILEGGPRYGQLSTRPGYNTNDVAWGFTFGEYQGNSEIIAIVQPNGSGTARVYSINPTTHVWTALTAAAATAVNAGDWVFTQLQDKIYASNVTDGTWYKTIGTDEWVNLKPEFRIGQNLSISTLRPGYPQRLFSTGTDTVDCAVATAQHWIHGVSIDNTTGNVVIEDTWRPDSHQQWPIQVMVRIAAGIDLSNVDHLAFTLTAANPNGSGLSVFVAGASGTQSIQVKVSTDVAATFDNCIGCSIAYDATLAASTSVVSLPITVNLTGLTNAQKSAIKTIGFGFTAVYGGGVSLLATISPLSLGGADMNYATFPPSGVATQDYAYVYYTTSTNTESAATLASLPKSALDGTSVTANMPKMGAWVQLNPAASGAADKIRIYRREANNWYRIAEINNSGSPSFIDNLHAIDVRSLPIGTLTFGSISAVLPATAAAVWKSHLCLAVDRKMYLSWGGLPNQFLPSPDTNFIAPSAEDTAQGATFYVSNGRNENMIGLASQDSLYMVGNRFAYVVIGDSALNSTPPRKLPGSRGALGNRASAAYGAGILVGAQDGLWFYSVSRAFTGSTDTTYAWHELSLEVRASWARLIATNPQKLVIVEELDTIWAFCEGRYMRYTRPTPIDGDRRWEEGTYANLSVKAAMFHPAIGLRVLGADGSMNLISSVYTTDNGTTVNFSYTTGIRDGVRSRVDSVIIQGNGTPSIQIVPFDGKQTITPITYTRLSGGQVFIPQQTSQPGFRHSFVVSGVVGRDTVEYLSIEFEQIGKGQGN